MSEQSTPSIVKVKDNSFEQLLFGEVPYLISRCRNFADIILAMTRRVGLLG